MQQNTNVCPLLCSKLHKNTFTITTLRTPAIHATEYNTWTGCVHICIQVTGWVKIHPARTNVTPKEKDWELFKPKTQTPIVSSLFPPKEKFQYFCLMIQWPIWMYIVQICHCISEFVICLLAGGLIFLQPFYINFVLSLSECINSFNFTAQIPASNLMCMYPMYPIQKTANCSLWDKNFHCWQFFSCFQLTQIQKIFMGLS